MIDANVRNLKVGQTMVKKGRVYEVILNERGSPYWAPQDSDSSSSSSSDSEEEIVEYASIPTSRFSTSQPLFRPESDEVDVYMCDTNGDCIEIEATDDQLIITDATQEEIIASDKGLIVCETLDDCQYYDKIIPEKGDLITEDFICDGDGNCQPADPNFELPEGVNEMDVVIDCAAGLNDCQQVYNKMVYDDGRVEVSQAEGFVPDEEEKVEQAITTILPDPRPIQPYSPGDLDLPASVLRFANASLIGREPIKRKQMGNWILYGNDSCPSCRRAKDLLSQYNQRIVMLNSKLASPEQKQFITNIVGDYNKIPVILLDNNFIGGSEDLSKLLARS